MIIQERKSKMAANVQDWQTSGLSQVEYARAHNIKVGTLRYQITRFRQMADEQPAFVHIGGIGFQEIHIRYSSTSVFIGNSLGAEASNNGDKLKSKN